MTTLSQILDVVRAVEAVDAIEKAKKRVPSEYVVYTFFSRNDLWFYHLVYTETTCNKCIAMAQPFFYRGNRLRGLFPDLEITDVNRIEVNIHPNCKCFLSRIKDKEVG